MFAGHSDPNFNPKPYTLTLQGPFFLAKNPTLFSEGRGAAATRKVGQPDDEPARGAAAEPSQRRRGNAPSGLLARAVADAVNPASAERNAPRRPISERLQRPEELPKKVSRGESKGDAVVASSPPRKARWDAADEHESDAEEEKSHRHKKHKKHRRN